MSLKLLPHQETAINWMKHREASSKQGMIGGIINAEMGLGKTVIGCTISQRGKTLVVVPKPLIANWVSHYKRWYPETKFIVLHNEYDNMCDNYTYKDFEANDVVITTYDVVVNADRRFEESKKHCLVYGEGVHAEHVIEIKIREEIEINEDARGFSLLFNFPWDRIIADEAHRFCNHRTKCFRAMMALYADVKWCLTGTPIRNSDNDLWSLFRFCGYNENNASDVRKWNVAKYKNDNLEDSILNMDYKIANITLPTRHDHIVNVPLTDNEKTIYRCILKELNYLYTELRVDDFIMILVWFLRLRQSAIASYLTTSNRDKEIKKDQGFMFQQSEKRLIDEITSKQLDKWVEYRQGTAGVGSSKVQKIVDIVGAIPANEKYLIFSNFTGSLEIIEDAIKARFPNEQTAIITGKTKDRDSITEEFHRNPNLRCLLVSYKVGSEGLNLTCANHVVLVEPWWCPSVHDQAASRVYRFGQTKESHIYHMYSEDTIEEAIIDITCRRKEIIKESFFNKDFDEEKLNLSKKVIGKLIGNELSKITLCNQHAEIFEPEEGDDDLYVSIPLNVVG